MADTFVMMVALIGPEDESGTCFKAVEMYKARVGYGGWDKKPNGWEGVVYTKQPYDLSNFFQGQLFSVEQGEQQGIHLIHPQSVYFIHPAGAVNLGILVKEFHPILREAFPNGSVSFGFTRHEGSSPKIAAYSFQKTLSGSIGDPKSYKAGNVIDFAFNRDKKPIFVSIFLGADKVRYRVVALGHRISDEEIKESIGELPPHDNDAIIDEGGFLQLS